MVILDPDGRTTPHCSLLSHDEFVTPSHVLSTLVNCDYLIAVLSPDEFILCHNNYQLWYLTMVCFPLMDLPCPITSGHLCRGVSAVVCS